MTNLLLYLSGIKTWLIFGALGATLLTAGITYGVKKYKEASYRKEIEKAKTEFTECVNQATDNSEMQACWSNG